ncbi:MAG: hypothetical protein EBT04_02355 [Betaproteobacteria bacterium]|nr:hypothetical protein [Betaproteobacteria bacterium]
MGLKFANNAAGELAQAITSIDTVATLLVGQTAFFPTLATGDYCVAVLQNGGTWEVVYITAISGRVITMTRAREGTVAANFPLGSTVELRVTAGILGLISEAAENAAKASWVGEVRMHSGSIASIASIPGGVWKLCDGTNGTPNLQNRFIVGAGAAYAPGVTGGATTATTSTDSQGSHSHGGGTGDTAITEAHMPSHAHAGSTDAAGYHNHSLPAAALSYGNGGQPGYTAGGYYSGIGTIGETLHVGAHVHSIVTDFRGGNQGHNHTIAGDGNHAHNLTVTTVPPYYALAFVMRVA